MSLTSLKKTAKTFGFIIFLFTVLGVTVFLGKNVSGVFMARASSCQVKNVSVSNIQVNSAVVSWQTDNKSQGTVLYGTDPQSLTIPQIEGSETTDHNVPLTLLTEDTKYYYLIKIKDTVCDATGQACKDNCSPWNFETKSNAKTDLPAPTIPATISPVAAQAVSTSGGTLSQLCSKISENIGKTSKSADWASVKQYDLDKNNIINARDVVRCNSTVSPTVPK